MSIINIKYLRINLFHNKNSNNLSIPQNNNSLNNKEKIKLIVKDTKVNRKFFLRE